MELAAASVGDAWWPAGLGWSWRPQFVLKKGSTGKFRFNLVATNGQVIATSEAYESKPARSTASNR
jgi:hypothetical protein